MGQLALAGKTDRMELFALCWGGGAIVGVPGLDNIYSVKVGQKTLLVTFALNSPFLHRKNTKFNLWAHLQ